MESIARNETNDKKNIEIKAAQYVRMSTEHQQYSTENQSEKIKEYALKRGIEIVATYADEGKSGLRIDGRQALQKLIKDVESKAAEFQMILVYDVSRWGRFQDADESAYYEYICKRSGIQIAYCAEQFENDGSPVSTIVKGVKRAMAGEYSRELSAKVFAGQCRLIELGYRQGGIAGYGMRRVLIDQNGATKGYLLRGEHKSLQTDRVILKPGPSEEVEIVKQIYNWFIKDGKDESSIAKMLNSRGIRNSVGKDWTRGTVREILSNEKYIGTNAYNRISYKLKKHRVVNNPEMWIRKEHAFEGIIPLEQFYTAQGIFRARSYHFSESELIEKLKDLYTRCGYLSGLIIDETEGMPSSAVYAHRFGSLLRAYQAVGFTPNRDYQYIKINQLLRRLHPQLVNAAEDKIKSLGGFISRDQVTDIITVNGEFTVSIVLARCQSLRSGSHRWRIRFDNGLCPDISIAIRLNKLNNEILDYYLLPRIDFDSTKINLADHNRFEFEAYRFEDLNYLYGMAARAKLKRAA